MTRIFGKVYGKNVSEKQLHNYLDLQICPKCGGNETNLIVYGLLNPKPEPKSRQVMGGCCGVDPAYECPKCKKTFGTYKIFAKDMLETAK